MPRDALLAVAFTDLNGNDKYNPGKDTLIASLVDTNNDNIVSVGDTIHWGTYPAIPDGSESGTGGVFLSSDSTVEEVLRADSTGVLVDTAGGLVEWFDAPISFEEFLTQGQLGVGVQLVDANNLLQVEDAIFVNPSLASPGLPNTAVNETASQLGDQAFLDVNIFSTGWDLV
jgi:hypothetical protein